MSETVYPASLIANSRFESCFSAKIFTESICVIGVICGSKLQSWLRYVILLDFDDSGVCDVVM